MDFTFAVTVKDEVEELSRLLSKINTVKNITFGTFILIDTNNNSRLEELEESLYSTDVYVLKDKFNGDFAQWKNKFSTFLDTPFIFQLDADELLSDTLVKALPYIIEAMKNEDIDLAFFPRINTVEGITEQDIQKWRWNVNEKGWINYPDYQGRLYKNTLKWNGKVHERIVGYQKYLTLEEECAILHPKDIIRQRRQNEFYNTIA